jgi:CubicO group peptidase (beta-lactamase class C family)
MLATVITKPESLSQDRQMRTLLTLAMLGLLLSTGRANGKEPADANTPTGLGNPVNLDNPIVPHDWQPLHDRWQAAMQELKVPGLAVIAVQGDQVVLLDTLGVCDPHSKQVVTPRSPFYLASVTKSFTALGVVILAEEGKLKLDEPVKTYLPRLTLADQELAKKITVRDLLTHRYGLNSSPISMSEAYFGNITDDRYYAWLASVESQGKFSYSNLHYTLAGRIIQAVSGKTWQDFLAERVFAPLEMRDSTCYASKLYANPLAAWPIVEHRGTWRLAPLVKNDRVMHAAGGMGASAADLTHWLRFQLSGQTPSGKRLVSPQLLADIHKQQVVSDDPEEDPPGVVRTGYSLGWFTGTLHGQEFLNHGGGYVGTSTIVSFLPKEKLGVAVLMNESSPNADFPLVVAADAYAKLLNQPLADMLPAVRTAAEQSRQRMAQRVELPWQAPTTGANLSQPVEKYAGTYRSPLWGDLQMNVSDGKLTARVGELALRLHALATDKIRLEIIPGNVAEAAFHVEGDRVVGLVVKTPEGDAELKRVE